MQRLGPYELVAELGRGGMGVVYQGFDPLIRRSVAIKTLRLYNAPPAERALLEDRLAREAQSAGRLSHPNIVTIHQIGYDQTEIGDRLAYIVMEYVPGQTLADRLTQSPPLDRQATLDILAQTADALDYAHSQGVIHRDIKPANLLLSQQGRVKVADFGIAKITSQSVTQTGAMLGSPYYMAPEQIRAEALDGRADQFSLAVVAFEMLSGQRPFTADTPSALVYQIAHLETPTASLLRAGLSPATVQVIRTAMAKQPADRYATCRQMVAALRDSFHAPFAPVPAARTAGRNTGRRGWSGWLFGLTTPILLAAGVLGWLQYRDGSSPALPLPLSAPPTATPKSRPRPAAPRQQRSEPASEAAVAAAPVITEPPPPLPEGPVTKGAPAVLRKVDPVYTEAARRARIEGVVSLRVRVSPAGIPEQIEVAQSLDPGLDQRAIEALSQWRFTPTSAPEASPTSWTGIVQLNFRLLNPPGNAAPTLRKK
jgi:TonB family protein